MESQCDAVASVRSRIDKLGLKPGMEYQAWGEFEPEFEAESIDRAGEPGEPPLDMIFVRLNTQDDLEGFLEARAQIRPNGMIWAVWPKGRKTLTETHIRDFALANGLVDVKVMSFSADLSGLKLVIPVAMRS